ncbi:MAG: LuxR C-terminal-related transcriptional regulator [Actinomycetota bacterium]|nr:LuxR C-terminal-related transcriptional regulator [Actinomycetota bacterium]
MRDVIVGRATELAAITAAFGAHRLVTIVGPPGVGKTRLAAEAAEAPSGDVDEVAAVELSAVSAPENVARSVAASLGVSNSAGATAIESAASLVGERRVLLSLDNCEHVLGAVVEVSEMLLERCPNLRVLATSRQALATSGESVVTLSPLASAHAMALFVARAHKSFCLDESNEEVVAEICRRLDGLPLAIELAAARTDVLAPRQLSELIDQRLSTVVADPTQPDPRHRTLDAAVAWSWDLLSSAEQTLLRRLSVFAGGATPSAVRAVCPGTEVATDEVAHHLGRLVDHSLVVAANGRYRLLEAVRHYARQQLAHAGEETEARTRHAAWATSLAERAEPHLTGPRQREWFHNLDTENDNLRAAIDWLVTNHQGEQALRLTSSLTIWWRATSNLAEGRQWFRAALGATPLEPSVLLGKALFGAGLLADVQGDLEDGLLAATATVEMGRQLGNIQVWARGLLVFGDCMFRRDAVSEASSALRECVTLARQADDPWCLSYGLALLARASGEIQRAEEAVEVAREVGDAIALAFSLEELSVRVPDLTTFARLSDEALLLSAGLNCPEQTSALIGMARVAQARRDWISAERYLTHAHEAAWRADSIGAVAMTLSELARVAQVRGDLTAARNFFERALAALARTNQSSISIHLGLARVAAASDDLDAATDFVGSAERFAGLPLFHDRLPSVRLVQADLHRRAGRIDDAQRALLEAMEIIEAAGSNPSAVADCLDEHGGLAVLQESYALGVRLFAAAASLRKAQGVPSFPPDHPHFEDDVRSARQSLSTAAFDRSWANGRDLGLAGAIDAARNPSSTPPTASDESWAQLTKKELAVLELLAQGMTDFEIAEHLFVAKTTVKDRLRQTRTKLGTLSRSALANEVARRTP